MTDVIDQFRDGEQGAYRFLSNFYTWDDPHFGKQSVEHWFQAFKAKEWDDQRRILEAPTASKAKQLGRSVKMREDWPDVKVDIMYACLQAKFSKQPFKSWLEDTRDAVLIEGNDWRDYYWGACRKPWKVEDSPLNREWVGVDGRSWYGKNMLGTLLMKVRDNGNNRS